MDFQKAYDREDFMKFLEDDFLPDDFEPAEGEIEHRSGLFDKVTLLGRVPSLNNLVVLEVKHKKEGDPRVSLSKDIFQLLKAKGYKCALAIFVPSHSSKNYRFSFIHFSLNLVGARAEREYSNPRRLSFYLGVGAKVRTPEGQLSGTVSNFEDLKGRFSIEVVNKEFFNEIGHLFNELAGGEREKKDYDDGLLELPEEESENSKKEFTVRLLGRLIFCWFLKKKKSAAGLPLIPDEVLGGNAVIEHRNYYHSILEPLFFEILNKPHSEGKKRRNHYLKGIIPEIEDQIPYLNGGLFRPHNDDFYKNEPNVDLEIPNEWFKKLFERLELYNFTIDENSTTDVELSVDPEMLGRIFENLLAEINPETGETARKKTGSYYTPREIVDYMVDESLKQYLLTKTSIGEIKIKALLLSYASTELDADERNQLIKAIYNLKIIDPAVGSGAFPMGILQKLVGILRKIDPNDDIWGHIISDNRTAEDREILKDYKGGDYLKKLGVIERCIYGVDIQPIAVDIARLRFFLTLIVDEEIRDDKKNRDILPLPNLEFNFVCANSLVHLPGAGLQIIDNIERLKKLRSEHFTAHGQRRIEIENEYFKIRNGLTGLSYLEHGLVKWNPFSIEKADFFDPEWMFGVENFDIVIGNPPYVQLQKFKKNPLQEIYKNEQYQSYDPRGDLYCLFYERGLELLRQQTGLLCYITSNKWMRAGYGKKLRKYFLKFNPKIIIDLGPGIFESAVVDTNILLIKRGANYQIQLQALTMQKGDKADIFRALSERGVLLENLSEESWLIKSKAEQELKLKLEKGGIPLSLWDVQINKGIMTGFNEAYYINKELFDLFITKYPELNLYIKPLFRGRTIKKYYTQQKFDSYVITINDDFSLENYPLVLLHLKKYKNKLEERAQFIRGDHSWYAIDNCPSQKLLERFNNLKIIYPNMTSHPSFSLDDTGSISNDKTFILTSENNIKYLCGVLNSKCIEFYLRNKCSTLGEDGLELRKIFIESIALPTITIERMPLIVEIERLVDKIVEIKRQNKDADTKKEEDKIDKFIYKLYDLTPEEIDLVEGRREEKDAEAVFFEFMTDLKRQASKVDKIKLITESEDRLDLVFAGLEKFRKGYSEAEVEEETKKKCLIAMGKMDTSQMLIHWIKTNPEQLEIVFECLKQFEENA